MKRTLITLACLLVVGAFYVWFLGNYEKRTERVLVGYDGEARYNDFFAAELLLNELDVETESRQRLRPSDWLPPESDTLVTRIAAELAVETQSSHLLDWVSLGGHLVLLPTYDQTQDVIVFLDRLNVRIVSARPFANDEEDDAEVMQDRAEQEFDYTLNLGFFRRIELVDETLDPVLLRDDVGIIATRQKLGEGFVTMFASDVWFRNGQIGEQDHARLFLDAVAGFIHPGKVWLVYEAEFAPLWRLLWDSATYLVVGLLLALAAWLWSRMPRFGPRLAAPSLERRSIGEHVSASGRFVWQMKASRALVAASVSAVLRKAERRHPGIGRLSREKQAVAIAHMVDEDPAEVLQALIAHAEDRPREFAQHMKLLQTIRNGL